MTFKIPIKNKYIVSVILGISVFVGLLVFETLFHRSLNELEEKSLDYRFRLRKEIPRYPYITTIAIEQGSLDNLGPWPWDRSMHARMVKLLSSFEVALINFDIFFALPSREPGDTQFIEAVKTAGNIILSGAFNLIDHPCFTPQEYKTFLKKFPKADPVLQTLKTREEENICIDFNQLTDEQWNTLGPEAGQEILNRSLLAFTGEGDREKVETMLQRFNYPFHIENRQSARYGNRVVTSMKPLLDVAAGFGHVSSTPDSDGVLRRIPLVIRVKDQLIPHMTLAALLRYLQVKPEDVEIVPGKYILLRQARFPDQPEPRDIKIPVDDRCRLRVNFPPVIEAHAFINVLAAENAPEVAAEWKTELKGKICTIGYTATGTGDIGPTPYEAQFPFAYVQAAIMNTILTQNFLYEMPRWATLLLTFVLMLAVALVAPRLSPLRFSLFIFAVIVGYTGLTILLFLRFGLILKLVSPVLLTLLLTYALITVYWYATEERERKHLRSAFKLYVSRQMLEKILTNPESLKLSGQRKEITIMFSDVRKFSTLSDKIEPEVIHRLLNLYFSRMTEIAFKYDGFVDKFIGDGLLCFFGDPIAHPDHALRAVRAAIDMQRAVRELGPVIQQELGLDPIVIRIGINTGYVIVGNMGSADRMEYTVLGSDVNLAQRLEASATPGEIMISENTYQQVKQEVTVRDMGQINVKGFEREIKVYEVQLTF